jgi:hypothetical protein
MEIGTAKKRTVERCTLGRGMSNTLMAIRQYRSHTKTANRGHGGGVGVDAGAEGVFLQISYGGKGNIQENFDKRDNL